MPSPSFEEEKPTFYTNHKPPGPSEAFVLSDGTHQVPYTINRYLRDYQREGVNFIFDNYVKSRGCILGDDMGLGKTVQVISFLAAVLKKTGTWKDVENNRPEFLQTQGPSKQKKVMKFFLIVAPLSVLYNWKDELDTWGHFRTVVIHGVRKEEELARVNRGRCEVALTTYETLRLYVDLFNSIDWAAVIADEVHKLKNSKSQVTQAMKELRCKVRVGLTGTILQNNLEELWCVMDWAIPGCLGSLGSFESRFSNPIEQGQKHNATKRALAEGRKAVHTLAKRLSNWFLRRTKAIISDQLPKKDDRVVYCSMTDFQRAVYRAVLDTDDVKLLLHSAEQCSCSSGRSRRKCCYKVNSAGVPVRNLYFSYLAILRKVANHVALLQSKEGTSKKQEQYITAVCEQVFRKCPDFTERCKQAAFEAMSDPIYSGKMKVLQKLLNHFITKKDKVLLFSLSTKLLDVLESYCMAEGLEYRRIDGTTKSKDRIHIVKEFNSCKDINLCLVSTMAGGLGLNFIGANLVVLFDPTWNPANDLQAIDRAYRIGQCRDVTVFRLISLGTVEEIIYLRQIYKQQLQTSVIGRENARRYFEAVQGAAGQAGELFGIRNLFHFQTDGTCLTHHILEREGRVEAGIKTASTQTMDDRLQELQEPKLVSADASTDQADQPEATHGTCARLPDPGILDFSSASEDEDPCSSRSNIADTHAQDEFGTTKMNLLALLQRHVTYGAHTRSKSSEESQSDENEDYLNLKESKLKGNPEWSLCTDSAEETNDGTTKKPYESPVLKNFHPLKTTITSEIESQDHLLPHGTNVHQKDGDVTNKNPNLARLAAQGPIDESFTSSENEASVKSVKTKKRYASKLQRSKSASRRSLATQRNAQKSVQFTFLKNPSSHPKKAQSEKDTSTGTIDTLLGGLQEVTYTHSNQKVVGSSRAENHLSHAALRDVFELKKHSQIPANHLSDHDELSEPADSEEDDQMPTPHDQAGVKHQVTHFIKTSIHTHNATIKVGQTPTAMCKKQLDEMAQFFGAKSVEEFAEVLVKNNTEQRQNCLREFYSHRNPELTEMIQTTYPKPVIGLKSVSAPTAACTVSRQMPNSKRTHLIHRNQDDAAGPIKKKGRTKEPHYSAGQSKNKHENSRLSDRSPSFRMSTDCNQKPQENSNVDQPVKGNCNNRVSGPSVNNPSDRDLTTKTLISDFLGDTSILDDLFKTKRNANQTTQASTPAGRTKTRGKDVWDILNEGNEESINKLTDLSQVEKFCQSINVSVKSKCETTLDSSQLWKKNEKFLWK